MKLFEDQETGKAGAGPGELNVTLEEAVGAAESADDQQKTGAAPDQLILDIEGLAEEKAPEPVPALKAETKELPDRREVLLAALRADLEDVAGQPDGEAAEPNAESPAEPAPEAAERQTEAANAPAEAPLLSYQDVAQAVVDVTQEPSGRFIRNDVDDETLLKELYALIGRSGTAPSAAPSSAQLDVDEQSAAEEPELPKPAPVTHPAARITEDDLQATPLEYEELPEDESNGVPGWLKGAFLLLISLLLSAMTFYAVAFDLLGKVF